MAFEESQHQLNLDMKLANDEEEHQKQIISMEIDRQIDITFSPEEKEIL